jgi:DNA-binding PadR family transcriptional regulator
MTRLARRSPLGLMILTLLSEEPMHAYRMQQLIRQRGKDKVVNVRQRASIHQVLARLQRLGLLHVEKTVRATNRPDRTVYAVTDHGRAAAKAWLREMLTAVHGEFPEFPAAVSVLALLTPEDARRQLEIRMEGIRAALRTLDADAREAGDLPRLFLLEDAYRTAILRAELTWLHSVTSDLASGELNWSDSWLRAIARKHDPAERGLTRRSKADAVKHRRRPARGR